MADPYKPRAWPRWKRIRSWNGKTCELTSARKLRRNHGGKCYVPECSASPR
jgi:hypothetical protein